MRKHASKGFTLLELLVVIGIISVLVGLGTVAYSTAQKKSRDAKRKGDMKAMQSALEQYYSVCGYVYPGSVASGIVCASPAVTFIADADMPTDPTSGLEYDYTYTGASNTYTLCAPNSPAFESEATDPYCLDNQQ
jgi:prepilin-type N-terminal cleavage/methylation domain-containing protein